MGGRVLMIGRKDPKTGLEMLPLSMDESTISNVATSISQVVSSISPTDPQPKTQLYHYGVATEPPVDQNAVLMNTLEIPVSINNEETRQLTT